MHGAAGLGQQGLSCMGLLGSVNFADGANSLLSGICLEGERRESGGGAHLVYVQWALKSMDDIGETWVVGVILVGVALAPRRW